MYAPEFLAAHLLAKVPTIQQTCQLKIQIVLPHFYIEKWAAIHMYLARSDMVRVLVRISGCVTESDGANRQTRQC